MKNSQSLSPRRRDRRDAPPKIQESFRRLEWRRLVKPPSSKKPSLDFNIDATLVDTPDEPVVEAVNCHTEDMEVEADADADVDEVNDVEKNADLEAEEDESAR
jgi:hypothetical protein